MWGEGKGLGERQATAVSRPSVLQRLDDPGNSSRDFAVAAASHPFNQIKLDPGVLHVKTGTPVRPTRTGWVVCGPDEAPTAFAGNHHMGGESFVAYRALTLEGYKQQFWPGDKYAIRHVDDYGQIYFTEHPDGPYQAVSESQILLDAARWRPLPQVLPPVRPESEVAAPAMPQLQSVLDEHREDDVFVKPGEIDNGGDEVSTVRQEDVGQDVPELRLQG
jgi:hypothetical protein